MISVVPPGGFFIVEEDTRLEGSDRESLISILTDFRVANHLPIGDPGKEVDRQLGARSPIYHPPQTAPTKAIPPGTLLERVRDWLANRYSTLNRLRFVNSVEANRRAAICARCPKNIEWRSSCVPCVAEVERNVVIVGGNRRSKVEGLMACAIAGHENNVAVWLHPDHLKHATKFKTKLPRKCWLR